MYGDLNRVRAARLAPTGGSEVRVTEFQFKTADGVGWYRLNMEDHGPTGEWVFWTLKPRS